MIVLDQENQPVDRLAPFIWKRVEYERNTTIVRLFGSLIAYLPHLRRSYYAWAVVISFRPAQHISVYQFAPPHVRVLLFSHWEFGIILGYWLLGLRLGQPLVWLRRLQPA